MQMGAKIRTGNRKTEPVRAGQHREVEHDLKASAKRKRGIGLTGLVQARG